MEGLVDHIMRDVLTEAGFRNYSIWNRGDMLFAYYEVDDEERMAGVLAASAVFAEWRAWMEEAVYVEPGTGRKEWPMEMVFYHAGE